MRTLLTLCLLASMLGATAQTRPRGRRQAGPLYDSTKVSFAHTLPAGVTHKAAQQAVITYGKIGGGKLLDHTDTLFLQQHDPAYLRAITQSTRKPQPEVREK